MAFDIYGNHLRPGYCEVHPDYYGEYPCDLCLEDSRCRQTEREHERNIERERGRELELEWEWMYRTEWSLDHMISDSIMIGGV